MHFTSHQALEAINVLGVDLESEGIALDDLVTGMNVELEHGSRFTDLDVTGDDPVVTAKIALAHLREYADYYERLATMEQDAELAGAAAAVAADTGPGVV
ncbi:MAG: DUF5661 family protein [Acidimicrobiia bacterium]